MRTRLRTATVFFVLVMAPAVFAAKPGSGQLPPSAVIFGNGFDFSAPANL